MFDCRIEGSVVYIYAFPLSYILMYNNSLFRQGGFVVGNKLCDVWCVSDGTLSTEIRSVSGRHELQSAVGDNNSSDVNKTLFWGIDSKYIYIYSWSI